MKQKPPPDLTTVDKAKKKVSTVVRPHIVADVLTFLGGQDHVQVMSAPFEADWQLVRMEVIDGITHGTVTWDADIHALGSANMVERLCYKSANTNFGMCNIINADKTSHFYKTGDTQWTEEHKCWLGLGLYQTSERVRTEEAATQKVHRL